jgi:hypothetical protein
MDAVDSVPNQQRRKFVQNVTTGIAGFGMATGASTCAMASATPPPGVRPLVYKTRVLLDADLSRPAGSSALVTNDPDPANNTAYLKNGAPGTGSWVATFDRLANALGNGSGFQATGNGAVLRTVQAKLREVVSVLDYIPTSEHAGIYAGTSSYDCLPAFHAALANQRPHGSQTAPYGAAGSAIYVPCGTYHVGGAIEIKRRVRIYGDGSSMANSSEASRIVFPANSHGFIIHAYNTIGEGMESPPSTQGSGSILSGLQIEGTLGGSSSGHGVWLRGMATVEQCKVINWAGDGIHIVAGARAAGVEAGNANGWSVRNVRITSCGGHAMYVAGADANAGVGYQVQCSSVGLWGIYDDSFLGNTYVGCMTEVCGRLSQVSHAGKRYYCIDPAKAAGTAPGTDAAVWALVGAGGVNAESYPAWVAGHPYAIGGSYASINPNARNVFIGCYSEGSQPPSHVLAPACVFGGLFGSVTLTSTAAIFADGPGGAIVGGGLSSVTAVPAGTNTTRLGGDGKNGDVLASMHTELSPRIFRLHYNGPDLVWDYANNANSAAYRITGPNTAHTFGRSVRITCVFQVDALWVGSGNEARMQGTGTAPPVTGSYARGDYIRNSRPAAGSPKGWFCVAAGSPGTWVSEGNL